MLHPTYGISFIGLFFPDVNPRTDNLPAHNRHHASLRTTNTMDTTFFTHVVTRREMQYKVPRFPTRCQRLQATLPTNNNYTQTTSYISGARQTHILQCRINKTMFSLKTVICKRVLCFQPTNQSMQAVAHPQSHPIGTVCPSH